VSNDLSGTGNVFVRNRLIGDVFYWLTIDVEVGPVVAEGTISGPEDLLSIIRTSGQVTLMLHDGPTFALVPFGRATGTSWVRLFAPE
jgi:hypothetical protein